MSDFEKNMSEIFDITPVVKQEKLLEEDTKQENVDIS